MAVIFRNRPRRVADELPDNGGRHLRGLGERTAAGLPDEVDEILQAALEYGVDLLPLPGLQDAFALVVAAPLGPPQRAVQQPPLADTPVEARHHGRACGRLRG